VVLLASSLLALCIFLLSPSGGYGAIATDSSAAVVEEAYENKMPVEYECPVEQSQNNITAKTFDKDYIEQSKSMTTNMTEFNLTFRDSNFDKWGISYEEVKASMHDWKSKQYPKYLKSGDSIYESAAGVGLNLMMTLEILREYGIENLHVYGNEYVEASTEKANLVLDHLLPSVGGAKKGRMCTADSSDTPFVPSDAFDLVYTGYLSPIRDPLHYDRQSGNANYYLYRKLCEADPSDTHSRALLAKSQQIQNDWYGKWAAEMIRIAKPGGAVIIEQVSVPYCDCYFDWGGVTKEFWINAAKKNTYGWNVDPDSLVFDDDVIFKKRYHLLMIKKDNTNNNNNNNNKSGDTLQSESS
jgi:hypothetical protein